MSTTPISHSGQKLDPDTLTRVGLFAEYLETQLGRARALDPTVQTNALPQNCIAGPQAMDDQTKLLAEVIRLYRKSYNDLAQELTGAGYAVQPFPATLTPTTNYDFLQNAVEALKGIHP